MNALGILYIVATPIGNMDDLTARAIKILQEADVVACEEWKEGRRLLRYLKLEAKELAQLNEHNEVEGTEALLEMLSEGKSIALVSDCGTPLFADPGRRLVELAALRGVKIVPVPGVSSFVTALMVSGFKLDEFIFRGMLSAKSDERKIQLRSLRNEPRTVILFDTPYRLERLMSDLEETFGDRRQAVLVMDLTTPQETILRGSCSELARAVAGKQWKREFVVVLGTLDSLEHFQRTRVR